MAETGNADIKKLTFERAIEELETIVKRLEEGKVPLEESVAIYERGEALKRRCEELLRQAEARVEKITLDRLRQADRDRAAGRELADSWEPKSRLSACKPSAAIAEARTGPEPFRTCVHSQRIRLKSPGSRI